MEGIRKDQWHPKKNQRNLTKEQSLAEEVWTFFGKQLSFPRIMREIKGVGYQYVYETFQHIKKNPVDSPSALFIWRMREARRKIKLTPVDNSD